MNESFMLQHPFRKVHDRAFSTFCSIGKESDIREGLTMGKDARAKEGKWHGGTPPKRYICKDGELIVDDFLEMQIRDISEIRRR